MVNTYDNYLSTPKSLSVETMEALHKEIVREIEDDADAKELYDELLRAATSYAGIRAKWLLMSREEKMDTDSLRTALHNGLITHFDILARCLQMNGKEAKWRSVLGNESDDRYCRKTIGDFACYLVFINSICAR